ncbi:carbohydrate porin [Duganella sp. LX20W]|uniref:Carbohydrate porin n=1 Tax=Rugamonas brunnea TaxID=2758569 RepID=A0A7W2ES76_9BURK|nr:carbohydrate porin [Rugamonas brunnea]MBA5637660.1 carbohydrate porin [Rugamonas brunnea]
MKKHHLRRLAAAPFCLLALSHAHAQTTTADDNPAPESWAIHGQLTNVTQGHKRFASPYQGQNSLDAAGRTEETTDITLYAGVRLPSGTELWLNPEIDQGFGLSNTVGMAGFPSGEAYKVGADTPYLRLPRAFLRHTFALGGAQEAVEAGPNQLGGARTQDNVVLTAGKFSVTDIFDTNSYAHDPRGDFLNWSLIDAGAFDYAADAWGFTYGAALEWNQGSRTVRAGVFQLSAQPNGKIIRPTLSQFMLVAELEQRYQWDGHGGKVKLLGFANHASMARYADAVHQAAGVASSVPGVPSVPDVAGVRRTAWRTGLAVNLEQELTADVGLFARASVNDGAKEAYEFTEINRSLSGGVAVKGAAWGRPDDTVGVAAVVNGLSGDARAYFAQGGIGILIGDGGMQYGAEQILEAYYAARLGKHLSLTLDVQEANHPAYNRSRGPVHLLAARVHAEF